MLSGKIFETFIQAGFECSTHRLKTGKRLDLLESTRHDQLAKSDYKALQEIGIGTVREGIRWHLIESTAGMYDFSSALGMLDAAEETNTQQIIDLFHFGWPDHLDIFSADFVHSFADLAFNFAKLLQSRGVNTPLLAPFNEVSFFAWAGGDVAYLNPFQRGRASELKQQALKAAMAACEALLSELPNVKLVWPDPVIHIAGDPAIAGDVEAAEGYRRSMFETWDMASGRLHPELGGRPEFLQVIGVNFYDRNEWMNHGRTLHPGDQEYRPFHLILKEVWERYQVPIFISETGTENEQRANWFAVVADEVRLAIQQDVPVEGLCLYPILNHPGWDDDRHCYNGLFDYAKTDGSREMYQPLAAEIARQQDLFRQLDKRQERQVGILNLA